MKKLDVVTFGEAMAMFIAATPGMLHQVDHFIRELAGAETNVAIGLARLGIRSGWVSKVGTDAFGRFIVERLVEENVDINHVLKDANFPTGFQIKSKVTKGDPEVQYFRKGSAASHLDVEDFDQAYFNSALHMHMTGIPLAISKHTRAFAGKALSYMKEAGKTISFDPNLRPNLWSSKDEMVRVTNHAAFQCHYVLPGISEGEILTGFKNPHDIADYYLHEGVKLVVIKLGEKGAFYKTASNDGIVPAFKVTNVIDTVGAGDGFAVGLISGLLEQLSIEESIIRGNAIGALAVQTPGDNDGYPTRKQLQDYIIDHLQGAK